MTKKVDLFLDSGAYSAWTKGVTVNIHDYISFIKEHEDIIEVYANLDVIGDAKTTYKNQRVMERAGLNPLPVFHRGEPEKYLRKYLEKYPYICLGGLVGDSVTNLVPWLDNIFSEHLIDKKGFPIIKAHGFGLTSLRLMLRYPWYSVDSTSWVVTGRMGSIYVPRYRNGKWIHNENSWKIAVSSRSPGEKEAGKHFNNMSPLEKKTVLSYLEEKGYGMGKSSFRDEFSGYVLKENEKWFGKEKDGKRKVETIEERGLCNDYKLRDEINIIYFLDLERGMPEWPWPFKKKSKGFLR